MTKLVQTVLKFATLTAVFFSLGSLAGAQAQTPPAPAPSATSSGAPATNSVRCPLRSALPSTRAHQHSTGEPSPGAGVVGGAPGADAAGVSPTPVQMRLGAPSPGADVGHALVGTGAEPCSASSIRSPPRRRSLPNASCVRRLNVARLPTTPCHSRRLDAAESLAGGVRLSAAQLGIGGNPSRVARISQ